MFTKLINIKCVQTFDKVYTAQGVYIGSHKTVLNPCRIKAHYESMRVSLCFSSEFMQKFVLSFLLVMHKYRGWVLFCVAVCVSVGRFRRSRGDFFLNSNVKERPQNKTFLTSKPKNIALFNMVFLSVKKYKYKCTLTPIVCKIK